MGERVVTWYLVAPEVVYRQDAAKNWEGDLYFMVEPREPWLEGYAMYFDLWHGECREACVVQDESDRSPKYRI